MSTNPEGPLWTPDPDRAHDTQMAAFGRAATEAAGVDLTEFDALHQWSVTDVEAFWSLAWDELGVRGDKGTRIVAPGADMASTTFFPEARLNFAENIVGDPSDELAYIWRGEEGAADERSRKDLHRNVGRFQHVLRSAGVEAGDRVAAWMPNTIASYEWMLAATGLGAIWSSASPDFGVDGVVDRFGQITPKVLIASDGYRYGGRVFDCLERLDEIVASLPSVTQVIVVPFVSHETDVSGLSPEVRSRAELAADLLEGVGEPAPTFERFPFDHPVFILYSSGTTGKPKSIVHRAGGVLITHMKEHQLHCDVRPGDRVFYFTTTGWMMWNWLATIPASGATAVAYDGNPAHPDLDLLFDMADELGITLLGTSAKYLESLKKAERIPKRTHGLDTVRALNSTGSPLSHEGFAWVYDAILDDAHLASMSGGTDLCGCFVGGEPTSPVYAGEIQRPILAMDVAVVDADGSDVAPGEQGELVCRSPFPSMPLTFWGDDGDARYHAAYFERFPGMWHQGDFAEWTANGGLVIHGRSDATLNPGGVRIGTAEIYRQLEEIDPVLEGLVIGQQWESDVRIVLFVVMRPGETLTDELCDEIRLRVRQGATPRHVPAKIVAVDDIPRTRSGKITEIAVRDIVAGRTVANTEALANPEALDLYRDLAELAD